MRAKTKLVPQNVPRELLLNELFFSTTNRKGIIISGNAVFARVSGYPADEMTGEPHNMIRHPDMPRAVFKLLWDSLLAGNPIAAYVKNLASDGRYYWVLALAAPTADGYLSVRFKPSSPLFALVEGVYRELKAIEQASDARGEEPKAGMRAAVVRLGEIIRQQGFADYDAFMRTVLQQELASRDSIIDREHRSVFPALPERRDNEGAMGAAIRDIYYQLQHTYWQINAQYTQLGACAKLNEQLMAQSRTILGLTSEFGLVSLNVAIKSSKLGGAGLALGVIATHLAQASTGVSAIVSSLADRVSAVSNWLGETIFSLAWARLQFEMTIVYHQETLRALADSGRAAEENVQYLRNLGDLRFAFGKTTTSAGQALCGLTADLNGLAAATEDLRKAMLSLQVAHVGGLIEAKRLTEDDSFSAIFEEVRTHIDGTKAELMTFNDVILGLGELARKTPVIMRTVAGAAERMQRDETALSRFVGQSTDGGASVGDVADTPPVAGVTAIS